MSVVTTIENQCRALTSIPSPDENASRFLIGTLTPKVRENLLYLFEYKDDNNNLAKVSFKFPFGESWHLSSSNKFPKLVAGVLGQRGKSNVGIFKLPDELDETIEDDYGLSESSIEQVYEPIEEAKNLVKQSHWHPEDGCQLLTCNDGSMQFWDVNEQKQVRTFSLLSFVENSSDPEKGKSKPSHITDLRWSSLFNCSVVAAAIGSRIYGIDTRIPDSSPSSICWLIEDQRCNRIRTIDFNPNSQYYIASGGDDCRANFWDLRRTSTPELHMQVHTHWIWSIRYNPFHDQLVLSAGGDARVALMRAQSVASEPYGLIGGDENEYDQEDIDKDTADKDSDGEADKRQDKSVEIGQSPLSKSPPKNGNNAKRSDEVVKVYEEHDDSVYATEWASDPWIFASLGFESRIVINKVPKAEKFNILF